MGCCTNTPGVGQVSLLHIPSIVMEWVGLESQPGGTITAGFSNAAGTHIVFIDNGHAVDIQVASADTIRIHNGLSSTAAGNVTLVW
jgi:hypothetical protein